MQVSDLFERENKAIAPAYFLERVSRQQKMDVKNQLVPPNKILTQGTPSL